MSVDLAPNLWPSRSLRSDLAIVFGLVAVLAWAAIVAARLPGTIAVVWLANGAATALAVSAPRERTLALLAAVAAGNLAANLAFGDPLRVSLAFMLPNALEVAFGIWLVRRTGLAGRFAEDQRTMLRIIVAGALLPPLLGATVGATTLQALGFAQFTRVWIDWYIGAALGAIAILPLGLALRASAGLSALARLARAPSLLVLGGVAIGTVAALRWMPYPFVVLGTLLIGVAFMRPRLDTFAAVPVVVSLLALLLALGQVPVADSLGGHAFLAALLALLPAQLVAVTVARQRALSQMLAAVGSRVDDIVTFVDLGGVHRWVNKAREAYWGVPNERLIGRTVPEVLPAEHWNTVRPMFDEAFAGRTARQLTEFDYPRRGRRTMDISTQPALDEEGLRIGALYCATDVTDIEVSRRELARAAEALSASHQSLEQFVRVAAHDLREPLNTITQFCSLIEESHLAQLDDTGRLYFAQVQGGATRMRQLLDDVLHFARLEQQDAVAPQAVDLDELMSEVRAALHARIAAQQAQVDVGPLGSVRGQRALLSLALQNLLANALKFVAPGVAPRVHVSAQRDGQVLRLQVADNGIGIEPARLAELGTPFRRLHARRKFEGTGLGLAICKRIAEQHGGRLEIESVPGQGSTFALILPLQ